MKRTQKYKVLLNYNQIAGIMLEVILVSEFITGAEQCDYFTLSENAMYVHIEEMKIYIISDRKQICV